MYRENGSQRGTESQLCGIGSKSPYAGGRGRQNEHGAFDCLKSAAPCAFHSGARASYIQTSLLGAKSAAFHSPRLVTFFHEATRWGDVVDVEYSGPLSLRIHTGLP